MDSIVKLTLYFREIFIVGLLGVGLYFLINIGNKHLSDEKKFRITKKHITYFILIVGSIFLIKNIYTNAPIISELIYISFISMTFAYILNPIVNLFEKKGIKRGWGVLLVYLIIIAIIVIISIAIVPTMGEEFKSLSEDLPSYIEDLSNFFNDFYNWYSSNIDNLPDGFQSFKKTIDENLGAIQGYIISGLESFTSSIINIFSKMLSIVMIPVLTFYFIKDKDLFKKRIILMIPKALRNDVLRVSREINTVLGGFLKGQLIVGLFVGITTIIALMILKIKFAFVIGIIAGIANIIPYFGPIIGIIPAAIFALLDDPIKVIWVIIAFTGIQQFESNILSPRIVGETVGVHPIVVMISLLIGGSLMGILGMLLAVPVAATIKILINFTIEKLAKI